MVFRFNPVVSYDTLVAVVALLLALLDLYLHWHYNHIRFVIRQESGLPAYNLGFTRFQKYQMVFFPLTVENRSQSAATVSQFTLLCPDGSMLCPSAYRLKDAGGHADLTLKGDGVFDPAQSVPLETEDLLNHLRFEAHDAASGYLVFFGIAPLTGSSGRYTLVTRVGRKSFRTRLEARPLPSGLRPLF